MPDDPKDKKEQDPQKIVAQMPDELTNTLAGIGRAMQTMYEGMQGISEKLEEISVGGKPAEGDGSKGGDFQGDLESLDRKDFMGIIVDRVLKGVDDKLKDFREKEFQPVVSDIDEDRREKVLKLIEEAQKAHPDFNEWHSEIKSIAQQMPGITPEDAYFLARRRDPEKAAKLDKNIESKKEQEASEETKRKEQEESEKKKKEATDMFSGGPYALTPTSGAKATEDNTNMDAKTAAETAWSRVFGGE